MTIVFSAEAAIIVLAYSMMIGIGFGCGIAVPFAMTYRAFLKDIDDMINKYVKRRLQ